MRAGRKSQPITIDRMTTERSPSGGFTEVWAQWGNGVWAEVKAKGGREGMDEGRPNAVFTVVFTIYNLPGLLESDRIMWGGVPYNIGGILREGESPLDLKVEAERGVPS